MPYFPLDLAGCHTRKSVLKASLTAAGSLGAGMAFGPRSWQGLASAAAAARDTEPAVATRSAATVSALTTANLDFAFRLQSTLLKGATNQNLFFSPLSVATALAMVYDGSAGATQKAMASTLAYKSLLPKDVNSAMFDLLLGLQQRDVNIKLSIANSMWLRLGATVVPAFKTAMRSSYNAALQSLDFKSAKAPATINAWVNQQTHGLIPSIVGSIDADTMLLLIDALYFKGTWSALFSKSATQPGPFTTGSGKTKTVPMMDQTGQFMHLKSSAAEIIRLPYGAGGFAMYVVLPPSGTSAPAFAGRLNPAGWNALLAGLKPQHGNIQMPRFSVTYSAGLKSTLSAMGMAQAFSPSTASFPGILQGQHAFITGVQHKAVMRVDESGTEAAAVTSIGVGATAMIVPAFHMVVNRPFLCAIRDDTTGTLLFSGVIVEPQ